MQKQIISIVLGTYNRLNFLKLTIDSIRHELSCCNYPSEIIVIDGGSIDGTIKWLTKQKDIISIIQHNHGEWRGKLIDRRSWGYFMNLGFKCAQGKYVCMVSDDCLVIPGSIQNGIVVFEEALNAGRKVGAVAFYWRNWPEQEKYRVGLTLGDKIFVNHGLFLRTVLEEVDYIDTDNYQFYHADGDLCLKMWQKGYVCLDSPDSYIEHYSHANNKVRSLNLKKQKEDWNTYLKKWEGIFYDSNLNYTGGWKEQEYIDEHCTFQKFKYLHARNVKRRILKRLTGKVLQRDLQA